MGSYKGLDLIASTCCEFCYSWELLHWLNASIAHLSLVPRLSPHANVEIETSFTHCKRRKPGRSLRIEASTPGSCSKNYYTGSMSQLHTSLTAHLAAGQFFPFWLITTNTSLHLQLRKDFKVQWSLIGTRLLLTGNVRNVSQKLLENAATHQDS